MSAEISQLRIEVADLKEMLVEISGVLGIRPELALNCRATSRSMLNRNDQDLPVCEVTAAQAHGDRSLLHAQNKRRLKKFKEQKNNHQQINIVSREALQPSEDTEEPHEICDVCGHPNPRSAHQCRKCFTPLH